MKKFRQPTALERSFLELVAVGHPEIEEQIATCLIADYDASGWCDVQVSDGPRSPEAMRIFGPAVRTTDHDGKPVVFETSLYLPEGQLHAVEVIVYDGSLEDPYTAVVEGAKRGTLLYPGSDGKSHFDASSNTRES